MFTPASSEFVALCQSQVTVLTQGLGAALSAVYLTTEELVEGAQPKLIPIVVHPEAASVWEEDESDLVLPEQMGNIDTLPRLSKPVPRLLPQISANKPEVDSTSAEWDGDPLDRRQRQMVLPLMHEGVVMGVLVTAREDRPWNEREQTTIERIARTLTIAYLLERRRVWYEQQFTQTKNLQARQRDVLDDILHQFRNPLTALRTFGKLLIKRLLPEDNNREVASSIVRESDRLQELLQEFDECLDMTQTDIEPLALPPEATAEATPVPVEARKMPLTPDLEHSREDSPHRAETTQSGLPLLAGKSLNIESFSINDVLEPLLLSATAIAQERDLELHISIPTDLPPVRGNARGLREVLNNLIENALKYTPAGGQIDIQVSIGRQITDTERIAIAISDTGPGIAPQDLEHLFERHYRGVQAFTSIPGSGLGLAIAKELIEQMHGEIKVLSPAQSTWIQQNRQIAMGTLDSNSTKGTTFIVSLAIAETNS
ncbi:sensor histidine kinase [Coleofasciculus sp. LEGE 07092]|nr:sensor histidine kinase [Coleofasciculus sp. LEGE 07081]MBE9148593.1 sensor histidine kinase [Coleofasciculus sp. LEGE 07092]